jgi:hypothetical protein
VQHLRMISGLRSTVNRSLIATGVPRYFPRYTLEYEPQPSIFFLSSDRYAKFRSLTLPSDLITST